MDPAVIVREDALELESLGLLSESKNGFRSISAGTLLSITSEQFSGTVDSGYASSSGTGAQSFLEIPDLMESQATLMWLGLNEETAYMLYQRWLKYELPDDPTPFIRLALDHVRVCREDAFRPEDNWFEALRATGVSNGLAKDIMDSEFTSIRLSRTAKEWVIDTFGAKYRVLSKAHEISKERAWLRPTGPTRKTAGTWTKTQVQSKKTPDPIQAVRPAYPQFTPGTATLWIGSDKARFDPAFPKPGVVRMDRMYSEAPTDFHGLPAEMLYTAVDRETAIQYARYARRRVGAFSPACVLSMQVPLSFIELLDPFVLNYGDTWKEVVWNSRRSDPLPRDLSYISTKKLILGPICGKATPHIARKSSWQDLDENDMMKLERVAVEIVNGKEISFQEKFNPVQYFFKGRHTILKMNEPSSGIIYTLHTLAEIEMND